MFEYKKVSHLSKSEQRSLIRQGRYVAFTKLKLAPKAVGYLVLSLIIGLFVAGSSVVFFGGYVAIILGALIAAWSYKIFFDSLVSKGLEYVLNENS